MTHLFLDMTEQQVFEAPEKFAARLHERYGEDMLLADPYKIAEDFGIFLVGDDEGHFRYENDGKGEVVNVPRNASRPTVLRILLYACALVAMGETPSRMRGEDRRGPKAMRASRAAAEFIIPEREFRKSFYRNGDFDVLARQFGVEREDIRHRAKDLRLA